MQFIPPVVGKNGFQNRLKSNVFEYSNSLPVPVLQNAVEDWLLDGRLSQQSPRTLTEKRNSFDKLLWFLARQNYENCGESELRRFLVYVMNGHQEPGGRWGNPQMTRAVGAKTVKNYFVVIQTFWNWAVARQLIEASPMLSIPQPKAPQNQIQPFSDDHILALILAARHSRHAKRNEAFIYTLFDTGMRASEFCGLRLCDFDLERRQCVVTGKGNKKRTVFYGMATGKAIWNYLRHYHRSPDEMLWLSLNGRGHGEPLQRNSLHQIIDELGKAGRVQGVRCSPHTFRHTFAVNFLRNGGNVFSLQQMMGHASLSITQRYVSLAQSDVQAQHRLYSPADNFLRRGKS